MKVIQGENVSLFKFVKTKSLTKKLCLFSVVILFLVVIAFLPSFYESFSLRKYFGTEDEK